jgi:cytochrome c oxidase subunit 2
MDTSFNIFPPQASEFAGPYDLLYYFETAVTVFFSALIFGLVIYFAIKYRRRETDQPTPTFESTRLEIFYTVVPFLIVMLMFFWGAGLYFNVYASPKDPLNIHVVGKQWMWKVQHMEGRREINELHVPTGRKVEMTMASQDVIHSFFIPAFRVKHDVVPGRYSTMTFTPTKPACTTCSAPNTAARSTRAWSAA